MLEIPTVMEASQKVFEKMPEKCGKDDGEKWRRKKSEKSLVIESRNKFPDPMLMTLDRGKISGKVIFFPLWRLVPFLSFLFSVFAGSVKNSLSNSPT